MGGAWIQGYNSTLAFRKEKDLTCPTDAATGQVTQNQCHLGGCICVVDQCKDKEVVLRWSDQYM